MKNDSLYKFYLNYLQYKLNMGLISKGIFCLSKISLSKFTKFKDRFEKDELFKEKMIELKSSLRDQKINEIIDETN